MRPETAPALIALLGVLLSILASVVLARRAAKAELKKLRVQLTANYADKLLAARIAVYPSLYPALSEFVKLLEAGAKAASQAQMLDPGAIRQLHTQIADWGKQNSIFLSDRAERASFDLRQYVRSLAVLADDDLSAALRMPKTVADLLYRVQRLEIALKVELGVYDVEAYENRAYYVSYDEIAGSAPESPTDSGTRIDPRGTAPAAQRHPLLDLITRLRRQLQSREELPRVIPWSVADEEELIKLASRVNDGLAARAQGVAQALRRIRDLQQVADQRFTREALYEPLHAAGARWRRCTSLSKRCQKVNDVRYVFLVPGRLIRYRTQASRGPSWWSR